MAGRAAKVILTEKQYEILDRIGCSPTAAARLIQRARIILMGFAGTLNQTIAREVGLHREQVGMWRRRWAWSFQKLVAIECQETQASLRRAIEHVLGDAPRSGSPGKFTGEQITQILAIACEPPEQSGRPINAWTIRELADEAILRKVVASISTSQVQRYLAEAELQPHRCKYWLNTTEKDPQLFAAQVQVVCACYQAAPELYFQHHTHTVCVDEMTGIQALERIAKTVPMRSGRVMRIEFEYKRNGTLCLIGNWHVVEGKMIAPTISPQRTEEDFVRHIAQTVASDPQAGWVFVADNLNTHASEGLVRYVAQQCHIDQSALGRKGKSAVLQSVATRQAFLSDRTHRVRLVYLPKHTSWLNQVEIVFGIVTRRLLKRNSFVSVKELRQRLLQFIDYFNRTFAHPFRWTYTGRPLTT
jgi:transposase